MTKITKETLRTVIARMRQYMPKTYGSVTAANFAAIEAGNRVGGGLVTYKSPTTIIVGGSGDFGGDMVFTGSNGNLTSSDVPRNWTAMGSTSSGFSAPPNFAWGSALGELVMNMGQGVEAIVSAGYNTDTQNYDLYSMSGRTMQKYVKDGEENGQPHFSKTEEYRIPRDFGTITVDNFFDIKAGDRFASNFGTMTALEVNPAPDTFNHYILATNGSNSYITKIEGDKLECVYAPMECAFTEGLPWGTDMTDARFKRLPPGSFIEYYDEILVVLFSWGYPNTNGATLLALGGGYMVEYVRIGPDIYNRRVFKMYPV